MRFRVAPYVFDLEFSPPNPKLARAVKAALRGLPKGAFKPLHPGAVYGLSISSVSRQKIHALNRDYRKKDRPTDVLSFSGLGRLSDLGASRGRARRNGPRTQKGATGSVLIDTVRMATAEDEGAFRRSRPRQRRGPRVALGYPPQIGDVILSPAVVRKQAKELGVPAEEELVRIVVHGVLHLFGYDHETNERDARRMFRLQNKILASLGITPESLRSDRASRPSRRDKGWRYI